MNTTQENVCHAVESVASDLRIKLSELLDPASRTEPGLLSKAQCAWLALSAWEDNGREVLELQPSFMAAAFKQRKPVPTEVFSQPWARSALAFVSADARQWLIIARVPAMKTTDFKPDPALVPAATMVCYVSSGILSCLAGSFSLKTIIDGEPLFSERDRNSEVEALLRMSLSQMVTSGESLPSLNTAKGRDRVFPGVAVAGSQAGRTGLVCQSPA